MITGLFQKWSLKTKVTLCTLIIFWASIWLLTSYACTVLRDDIKQLLYAQQFATVSIISSDINSEITNRLAALEKAASKITPAIIGNKASMQTFLEDRLALQTMFNSGIFITRPNGTAIADVPLSSGRVGVNYSDRDFIAETLKGKTTIGKPVMGRMLRVPLFTMATPIRDNNGKVIGILTGVIDLSKPSFLNKITDYRYGKSGGFILIAPQHKLFVTATDKSYIMQPMPAPGINSLMDRYVNGFEGSGNVVDARGEEVLSSSKQIPAAGWVLVVRIAAGEAFAPILSMQFRMYLVAAILSLLAGGLTWWLLKRQLSPVFDTLTTLSAISGSNLPVAPLPVIKQDEVGQLITGFNRLLVTLSEREKALRYNEETIRRSEEKYRHLFLNQPTGFALHEIILDAGGIPCNYRFLEINPAFEIMTGLKAIDLVGRTLLEVLPSSESYWIETYGQVALSGKAITFENFSAGLDRHYQVSAYSPEPGKFATVFLDITDRKLAELELQKANDDLEKRVEERTAELLEKDRILLLQSRQAAMGEMIGNIAHQWRQPLNTLGLSIQQLLFFYDLGSFSREFLEKNVIQSMDMIQHMSRTIDDFRNYFRPDKEKVVFGMAAAVAKSLSLIEESFKNELISIKVNLESDPTICGYPNEFSQVVLNILLNARDALTEKQIVTPWVAITISGEGTHAVLTIADNAGGIDEEIKDKIFDPYFTTKGPHQGTGVGLYMSKSIIEKNMGGRLWVRNTADGAEFTIEV